MAREAIYSALFTLLSAQSVFKTKARRVKLYDQVSDGDMPALFLMQTEDEYKFESQNKPVIQYLGAEIYIYFSTPDPHVIPATQLNTILDAIDTALKPDVVSGRLTLGGLVSHCRAIGKLMFKTGELDGQGLVMIPIQILVNQ